MRLYSLQTLLAAFAATTLLAQGGTASAQTVTGSTVRDGGRVISITANDGFGTRNRLPFAKYFTFTQQPSGNNPLLPNTFLTYCVELSQAREPASITYGVSSTSLLVNPTVGGQIAWLYNTYAATALTDVESAALQTAIWEVRYDGTSHNLEIGNFILNNSAFSTNDSLDIKAQATIYLASIGSNTSEATLLTHPSAQDLVGPNRVPEPAALAFAVLGIAGLLGLRRRA